ncbi:hypothetical protein NPIL_402611 [Nephila pilipes]|uniref:Uncharacterized protein n=1 Tax=Nephila pilipes TaxID=299642 RepID=A0A8X6PZX0_NEPPI|nr:hypothetical protein NPIL_402611 [Nephila pilipes]
MTKCRYDEHGVAGYSERKNITEKKRRFIIRRKKRQILFKPEWRWGTCRVDNSLIKFCRQYEANKVREKTERKLKTGCGDVSRYRHGIPFGRSGCWGVLFQHRERSRQLL